MNIQAVLFDLDGTLLNTLADIAAAGNHTLAQLGFPTHDVEKYRWFVGDGADVLMQRILPADKQQFIGEALAIFKRYYNQHVADHTTIYDGIPELLDTLTQEKVAIAVLTNKPQVAATSVIQHFFSRWNWKAIHGHRDGVPKKPDPAPALALAREMNVEPSRTIFLGDSHVDMNTARNAGMIAIGAGWGFRTHDELTQSGAKKVIDLPTDLIRLMEGL